MYKPIGRVFPRFLRLWHAADFWEGVANVTLGAAVSSTLTTHGLYVTRKKLKIFFKFSHIIRIDFTKLNILFVHVAETAKMHNDNKNI